MQYTKESRVQTGGVLVTMNGKDGTSSVVQTAAFQSQPVKLHSALPDSAFDQLKVFSANSSATGSHVSLHVLGFARVQGSGICGSVVKILTAAGEINLDGPTMNFAAEIGDIFVEAGFVLDASRRRLGDAQNVMLLGIFNYFMAIDSDTLACNPLGSNSSAASVPTSYHARIVRLRECGYSKIPGFCTSAAGLSTTITHPDFPGKRFFRVL